MQALSSIRTAFRPIAQKGSWYWLRFAVLLAAGAYAGHLMSTGYWLTETRYKIYRRQLTLRDHANLYPRRTALVLLDDDDYWGDSFQARTPLKRHELAVLLNRLNEVGVNTVALDVDLRSPRPDSPAFEFADYKGEDSELISAVERMCAAGRHVILASSVRFGDRGYEEMPSIYTGSRPSLPCLQTGYIQLPYDMRRVPGPLELADGGRLDSLSLAVVAIADPTAYAEVAAETGRGFRFSQFLMPADFATRQGSQHIFSGREVKMMDTSALRRQLADKLVFLGASWHSNAYGVGPQVDMHASPGGPEPGVMLHANYVEAMLDRSGTFTPVSDATAEGVELFLVLALGLFGALNLHFLWKWAALLTGCLFSILLSYTLLQNLGLFLDFLVPLVVILLHKVAEELLMIWRELRLARKASIPGQKSQPVEVFQ